MSASSSTIIPAPADAAAIADDLERLWAAFVEASTRAQSTLVFEDGMAARDAWVAFMQAYDPQRPPAGATRTPRP